MNEMVLCVVPTAFLAALFGTIVLVRWFKHREIMAMVEKGVLPKQYTRAPRRRRGQGLLGWGIALSALGLALMIGLWPLGFGMEDPYPLRFGPWMLIGLIPLFIGLALLILYFVTRKEEAQTLRTPPEPSERPELSESEEEVQVLSD